MKKWFALCLCLPVVAEAAWTVKEIDAAKKTVVIQSNPPSVIVKKAYVVDIGEGLQCTGRVVSTRSSFVQLDLSSCPHFERIRGKMTAEEAVDFSETAVAGPSAPAEPPEAAAEPSSSKKTRGWVLRPGLALSNTASFKEAQSSSATAELLYKGSSSFSVAVDYLTLDAQSWNWRAGGRYDTETRFDEVDVKTGGTTVTVSGSGPKMTALSVNGGFFYRWETFYLGFGGGLVSLDVSNRPTGWKGISGGVALGGDLGWLLDENWIIGLDLRSVSMKTESTSSGSSVTDFGFGSWGSFSVTLGYRF